MAVTSTVIASSQKRIQKIFFTSIAAIAQLGERQTEDLQVPGSIPGLGIFDHAVGGRFMTAACMVSDLRVEGRCRGFAAR